MNLRAAIALASSLTVGSTVAAADEFDFVIAPYALLPSITGDADLGRVSGIDVDVTFADLLEVLEAGAMIHGEVRHQSGFGVMLDYAFMRLGDKATGPVGLTNFDIEVFQGVLEAYGSYRLTEGDETVDVYAGIRYWDIDVDVDASLAGRAFSIDRGEDWVDPVIGVRGQARMSDQWSATLQADIGGFGAGSDFSWNVMGGASWDRWENTSLFFGYRALAVDFTSGTAGTPGRFVYDTVTHGPLIGAVFKL